MGIISPAEWAQYENDINDFHDDANQQSLIWKKCVRALGINGDEKALYKETELEVLVAYNQFRSWPINVESITGEVDKESCLVYINKAYLQRLGLLDAQRQFKYNPSLDLFELDGVRYKSAGDSATAQTNNKTLFHFMVLKRDYLDTPDDKYDSTV